MKVRLISRFSFCGNQINIAWLCCYQRTFPSNQMTGISLSIDSERLDPEKQKDVSGFDHFAMFKIEAPPILPDLRCFIGC